MLRTGQAKSVRAVSQVSYESGVRVAGPFFFFLHRLLRFNTRDHFSIANERKFDRVYQCIIHHGQLVYFIQASARFIYMHLFKSNCEDSIHFSLYQRTSIAKFGFGAGRCFHCKKEHKH